MPSAVIQGEIKNARPLGVYRMPFILLLSLLCVVALFKPWGIPPSKVYKRLGARSRSNDWLGLFDYPSLIFAVGEKWNSASIFDPTLPPLVSSEILKTNLLSADDWRTCTRMSGENYMLGHRPIVGAPKNCFFYRFCNVLFRFETRAR